MAHGWTAEVVAALPLTATVAESLATKADQDEAVKRARDACRLAWRAASEARASLEDLLDHREVCIEPVSAHHDVIRLALPEAFERK